MPPDGYARASGKAGVLLTHLGPGLTNATTGVANAALDSIPMVVISGDVPSHFYGRHPHQEFNLHQDADQFQIYRPFCKRVYRVDRAADLPRIIGARVPSGAVGPPWARARRRCRWTSFPPICRSTRFADACRDCAAVDRSGSGRDDRRRCLRQAERPVIYAGGGVLSARATSELAALAEALDVPVAHSLMGKGCLREDHPLLLGMTGFWGTPIANDRCRTADVILAVGTRLAEASSSSWDPRFTFAAPPTRVIHIDADIAEIGRNLPTELGVVADAEACARRARRRARADAQHRARGPIREEIAQAPPRVRLEVGAAVAIGSVSRCARAHPQRAAPGRSRRRLHRHRRRLEQERRRAAVLDHRPRHVHHAERPGDHGASARRRCSASRWRSRDRAAVALIGDGGFGSNPSVVATAMEAGLNVVWLVMDNAAFGTIAGLEQQHYGWSFGCVFECDGRPYRVDFAAMARACGARGVMIESPDQLGPALQEALASRLPTVIQVPMENAPTPTPGHWNINDIYRKGE